MWAVQLILGNVCVCMCVCVCVCVCMCVSCSVMSNFLQPHGLQCQAPLSVGFSRQEYWSGLPLPSLVFMLSFLFLPESILGVSLNNVEVVVPTPHTIENLHTIISASKTDEWINDSSKDRKLKQFR